MQLQITLLSMAIGGVAAGSSPLVATTHQATFNHAPDFLADGSLELGRYEDLYYHGLVLLDRSSVDFGLKLDSHGHVVGYNNLFNFQRGIAQPEITVHYQYATVLSFDFESFSFGCSKKDLHSENDANDAQSCDLLVTGFAGNHDVAEARAHFTGGRRGEVEMMQVVLGPEFRGLEEISFYTYGAPDTVFTIFDDMSYTTYTRGEDAAVQSRKDVAKGKPAKGKQPDGSSSGLSKRCGWWNPIPF